MIIIASQYKSLVRRLEKSHYTIRVCLDCAKNSTRIEELRIANEDSEKIVIFLLAQG
jgi:hypothetical protein